MEQSEEIFLRLGKSKFRSRFRLNANETEYLKKKGINTIIEHARHFVIERLSPAEPENDGRQTPMRNHPAFVAQHATATCCRGCLEKWHKIPNSRALTDEQIGYIVKIIEIWLKKQRI